jgi:hypothetical protein
LQGIRSAPSEGCGFSAGWTWGKQRQVVNVMLAREVRFVLPAERAERQTALDDPLAEARG